LIYPKRKKSLGARSGQSAKCSERVVRETATYSWDSLELWGHVLSMESNNPFHLFRRGCVVRFSIKLSMRKNCFGKIICQGPSRLSWKHLCHFFTVIQMSPSCWYTDTSSVWISRHLSAVRVKNRMIARCSILSLTVHARGSIFDIEFTRYVGEVSHRNQGPMSGHPGRNMGMSSVLENQIRWRDRP
jgi:hypothetical protein